MKNTLLLFCALSVLMQLGIQAGSNGPQEEQEELLSFEEEPELHDVPIVSNYDFLLKVENRSVINRFEEKYNAYKKVDCCHTLLGESKHRAIKIGDLAEQSSVIKQQDDGEQFCEDLESLRLKYDIKNLEVPRYYCSEESLYLHGVIAAKSREAFAEEIAKMPHVTLVQSQKGPSSNVMQEHENQIDKTARKIEEQRKDWCSVSNVCMACIYCFMN